MVAASEPSSTRLRSRNVFGLPEMGTRAAGGPSGTASFGPESAQLKLQRFAHPRRVEPALRMRRAEPGLKLLKKQAEEVAREQVRRNIGFQLAAQFCLVDDPLDAGQEPRHEAAQAVAASVDEGSFLDEHAGEARAALVMHDDRVEDVDDLIEERAIGDARQRAIDGGIDFVEKNQDQQLVLVRRIGAIGSAWGRER